jgi:hypothetical protein
MHHGTFDSSFVRRLINAICYTVQEVGAGFFKTMAVRVSPNAGVGPAMRFDNRAAFLQWVQENLCSLP